MNGLRRRLASLESPGGYATIGDMLDALDTNTDMPNNIDPRIVSFLNRPDVLLDTDFDTDVSASDFIPRRGSLQ